MDRLETARTPIGDPLEATVALALEVGASGFADEARRMSEQLDANRVTVSIVARPSSVTSLLERIVGRDIPWRPAEARPLTIRYGRGACHLRIQFHDGSIRHAPVPRTDELSTFGAAVVSTDLVADSPLLERGTRFAVGTSDSRWPPSRHVDLVIADEAVRRAVAASNRWRRARVLVVDAARSDERERAFEVIDQMARESGADQVEAQLAQYNRSLCRRLRRHLFEQQRALGRDIRPTLARVDALTIARVRAGAVLDARALQPDLERATLTHSLTAERTRFLMSTKADALVLLDEHIAQTRTTGRELRRIVAAATCKIVVDLLSKLWERMATEAADSMALVSRRLLSDLEFSLGDLAEMVTFGGTTGAESPPIRSFQPSVVYSPRSALVDRLLGGISLPSRKRIVSSARGELLARLDNGAHRVTACILNEFDAGRQAIERRLYQLVDDTVESAKIAAGIASEAQAGGVGNIAQARLRLARWSATLAQIADRLE